MIVVCVVCNIGILPNSILSLLSLSISLYSLFLYFFHHKIQCAFISWINNCVQIKLFPCWGKNGKMPNLKHFYDHHVYIAVAFVVPKCISLPLTYLWYWMQINIFEIRNVVSYVFVNDYSLYFVYLENTTISNP